MAVQYVVLLSMMTSIFIKYIIHVMDMRREGRWDNKVLLPSHAMELLFPLLRATHARAPAGNVRVLSPADY